MSYTEGKSTGGLIPGGLIILVAIAIGHYGRKFQENTIGHADKKALEHEGNINFKGA